MAANLPGSSVCWVDWVGGPTSGVQPSGPMNAQLLDLVREVLYTLAYLAIPMLAAKIHAWLSARVKDERWKSTNDRLTRLVEDAVDDVEQTFVRLLKDPGTAGEWTPAQQAEARQRAADIVGANLGERGVAEAAKHLGLEQPGLSTRIATLVEAAIARRKREAQ